MQKKDVGQNKLMENEFEGFEIIDVKKLDNYNFAGVWAMFGYDKKSSNNLPICLNVGKTKCIKKELNMDLLRLKGINMTENKPKEYRNQFGEKIFDYLKYPQRLDFVYDNINENYKDFFWIIVVKENNYQVEKYFAYSFKAIYWVSNGQYKNEITNEEVKKIRESIDVGKFPELQIKINNLKNKLHITC